jgi:two-component system sensor histidine kinase AlgZ
VPSFFETLRALGEPRRLVPLALVSSSLLAAEWIATGSAGAVLVDLALVVAFVLVSPALFRKLSVDADAPWPRLLASWGLNVLVSANVVGLIALLLPPLFGIRWTYISEPGSLGVLVALFVVGGWGLGRDIELSLGVTRERARAERLAIEAEHAQILALRAQLDPHFLFNTLNAIAEWCREDPLVAEAATLKLAGILRTVFEALQTPSWTLAREVALLEQLAQLYAVRDAGRYVFAIDLDPRAKALEVPPLVLLPLFENAIKHGPAAGHRGEVALVVRHGPTATTIEIRNPGPFAGRREGGHGVPIVERRLALTYGDRAQLSIGADDDDTLAVLHLPSEALATR